MKLTTCKNMEGILAVLTLFLFGMTPTLALADSGTCINNGGVDCSTATVSGYVVCMDGTVGSTKYSAVAECKYAMCTKPSPGICTQSSDLLNFQPTPAYEGTPTTIQDCQAAIDKYQLETREYNSCTQSPPGPREYGLQYLCQKKYGSSAVAIGMTDCGCADGYFLNEHNVCVKAATSIVPSSNALDINLSNAGTSTAQHLQKTKIESKADMLNNPSTKQSVDMNSEVQHPEGISSQTHEVGLASSIPKTTSRHDLWYWLNPLHWFGID